ncbi:MAG: NAD(P)/FAD-dependent oxidoreductase [Deltaproteobacteria bacterium]|nr:NAD(P)/FAD-dependent oxidoreductase [Deltaproteobacteria bacterium]
MKLAIIGAGPGGLYAALAAVKQNISVDLYEKKQVGEGICCGECLFDSLGIMPQLGEGLLHPVREVILKGRDHYGINMSRRRKLWMLDRKTWQQGLAKQAVAQGICLFEQTEITPDRLLAMQKDYDWIIDGSGAPSITSRAYHFSREYFRDYMAAYQVVLKGDFSALWPRIKVGFISDLPAELQAGYYWIFPKDERHANTGVVCTVHEIQDKERLQLKKRLANVLIDEKLTGAEIIESGGGMASVRILPRLVFDNIILIGDAAGLTSPLHGGGIDMACFSGALAVSFLTDGSQDVGEYQKSLTASLEDKLNLEATAVQKMKALNFCDFDKLLAGVTSQRNTIRAKTALRHPDLLYATYRWLEKKVEPPNWPD